MNNPILNLEIGFGSGENMLKGAVNNINETFIGCDPYLKGALLLKKKIESLDLKNLILTNLTFQEFFEHIKHFTFQKY